MKKRIAAASHAAQVQQTVPAEPVAEHVSIVILCINLYYKSHLHKNSESNCIHFIRL